MNKVNLVTLQSLGEDLGAANALRHCAPICFYMLLEVAGYLDVELSAARFCSELDDDRLLSHAFNEYDWSRPALSRHLRQQYGAGIVSWWTEQAETSIPRMREFGYLDTDEEVAFFEKNIRGKSLKQIVQSTYPVIVTMKPGFGGSGSKNIHAVVLINWSETEVQVADPDARNGRASFTPAEVENHLFEKGAASIVLPKK